LAQHKDSFSGKESQVKELARRPSLPSSNP